MFEPYHQFRNCAQLETVVLGLKNGGHLPESIEALHSCYHYSLLHKLKAARYSLEQLLGTIASCRPEELYRTDSDTLFLINVHLEGFLSSSGSALDILARELLCYCNISFPNRVYYQTAWQQINQKDPNSPLLPRLIDPSWRPEFQDYRNAAIHEQIIASGFSTHGIHQGSSIKIVVKFPMPDNPRLLPEKRTFKRNPDVTDYAEKTFRRLVRHINQIYGDVIQQIQATGSLPI